MITAQQIPEASVWQKFWSTVDDTLDAGDRELKEWFLVESKFWPVFLCLTYFLAANIAPVFMKSMKPFEIRKLIAAYDLMIVIIYTLCVATLLYLMTSVPLAVLCGTSLLRSIHYDTLYWIGRSMWVLYLIKYVEFFDTVFFILRRKDNLLTNLHIIHHTLLPLIYWSLLRAEKSGFQIFPLLSNSIVHIFMYSYYGLAALGPSMRKYLWWKRYLTLLQLTHFVQVLIFVFIVKPLTGCVLGNMSVVVNVVSASLFFGLFFDFYQRTFNKASEKKMS